MTTGRIRYVLARFPQQRRLIFCLLGRCNTFRALCNDYAAAIEALRYWRQSEAPQAAERIREYQQVIAELEAEIRHHLEVQENAAVSKGR